MSVFPMIRCPAVALAILIGCAGPSPAAAAPYWLRVDTPNFIVFSDAGEKRASDIAMEFERFREALAQLLPTAALGSATPTLVVVFASERSFAAYQPQRDGKPVGLAGYFARDQAQSFIALSFQHRDAAMPIAFHEYAHLIIANLPWQPPAWLNEGIAEFYSTFRVTRGGRGAALGTPIAHHLELLRQSPLLPLEQLMAWQGTFDEERERRSLFYAQSWALVHMLLTADPSRSADLSRYGRVAGSRGDPLAAWHEVFGDMNVRQLLNQHVHRPVVRSFSLQFERELPKIRGEISVPRPGDIAAVLAALRRAAQFTDGEDAGPPPTRPRSALASALLGLQWLRDGRTADAEALLLEAGQDRSDWLAQYYVATGLAELIDLPGSPLIPPATAAVETVLAARPDLAHALALKARVLLAQARQEPAALEAVSRARALAPGRADYRLIAAEALSRQEEYARARAMVGPLLSSAYSPETREAARDFMGYLLEQERWGHDRPRGTVTEIAGGEPTPIPAFRRLQPGEQRTQGLFEGIECSATGVALLVRTGEGVERFTAPAMESIDFITYRDDTEREIGCGPRPRPERVTITWSPDPAGDRRVVALELLPDPR